MTIAALLIGALIIAQGILGLLLPEMFLSVIRTIQAPPVIYLAAVIRVLFGVILVLAASRSRAPMTLRGLGALIFIGGLLTPVFGIQFAEVVLGWWSQGPGVVRAWAGLALVLGIFIVYATAPNRQAPR